MNFAKFLGTAALKNSCEQQFGKTKKDLSIPERQNNQISRYKVFVINVIQMILSREISELDVKKYEKILVVVSYLALARF